MPASLSSPVRLLLGVPHTASKHTSKQNTIKKKHDARFVGEELWSPLMESSSKPCPGVGRCGPTMTSRGRNFPAGAQPRPSCSGRACRHLAWPMEAPGPCWAVAPAPVSWEQVEVKSCREAEVPGQRGSDHTVVRANRPSGNVPAVAFFCALGKWPLTGPSRLRHGDFMDHSGSKPRSAFIPITEGYCGTAEERREPRIGTNRSAGRTLNQTPILIFYKCNSDGINVVFVFKQNQTQVDQLKPESNLFVF